MNTVCRKVASFHIYIKRGAGVGRQRNFHKKEIHTLAITPGIERPAFAK